MKILFDISHPAHLNFFRNTICTLSGDKVEVVVTYLERGKLPNIVAKDLRGLKKKKIGRHSGTKLSIIFEANIFKFFSFIILFLREKPDICLSCGSFTNGLACNLFGIPNIQFDDDPERKINVALEKFTSTELYFPPIIGVNNKLQSFNALKEWAYLSPKYFTPNEDVLKDYNIVNKEYIFVREVSTGSFNYLNQEKNIIASLAKRLPRKYKVVLSLEDKKTLKQYPGNWILLSEPINDIHSLIYFSKYLISSGDSMAREGAMLGVPSIYCGFREMKANQLLMDKGMLFKLLPIEVPEFINKLDDDHHYYPEQIAFREKLVNEWIDVTKFILDRINHYKKKVECYLDF